MSRLALSNGDDHPEAARKHLREALVLLREGYFDGAGYLAGYAVECSFKTLLLVERPGSVSSDHDLDRLSADALRLAAIPGATTARYVAGWTPYPPMYRGNRRWGPRLRYRAAGHIGNQRARDWLRHAATVYKETVAKMWADGVL